MPNSSNYNMLHAFALGCLNKEDFQELKNFIKSGNDFEWDELGEYQNLAALLPGILNIEIPPNQLKDKVARKLYRIREERRKTIVEVRKPTQVAATPEADAPLKVSDNQSQQVKEFSGGGVEANDLNEPFSNIRMEDIESIIAQNESVPQNVELPEPNFDLNHNDFEDWKEPENLPPVPEIPAKEPLKERIPVIAEVGESQNIIQKSRNPILERLSEGSDFENEKKSADKKEGKKSNKGIWFVVFLLFIMILGLAAGGYYIYKENEKTNREIEKVRQQVNSISLKSDAGNDILSMISSREFKIAELKPSKPDLRGFGKILISYDLKTAYFQFGDLPELTGEKIYQLWGNISGSYVPLAEVMPNSIVNFEPIPKLPVVDKEMKVAFLLTEEKAEGAKNPSNKVLLAGEISNN